MLAIRSFFSKILSQTNTLTSIEGMRILRAKHAPSQPASKQANQAGQQASKPTKQASQPA
jgi:hypothetical protein